MRTAWLLLFVLPALPAQAPADPCRFVPPDAAIVLRTKGLAGWRAEFGGTGLGKVFASGALAATWTKLQAAAEAEFGVEPQQRERLAGLLAMLAGHAGEIVVGAKIDFAPVLDDEPPIFVVSLAVFGDGVTDLEALGKAIAGLLPEGAVGRQLAGLPVRVHTLPLGEMTAPFVRDGALVMLLGTDLEQQAPGCLEQRQARFPAVPELQRGALAVQFEVHELVRALTDALDKAPDETMGRAAEAIRLFGGSSVQRAVMSVFADGTYVGQEAMVEWSNAPRGLFAALVPARGTNPRILRYLPASAQNWKTGLFDVRAVQANYALAFEKFGDLIPLSREQLEARFTGFTKLRLHEDVLALLGDEYLQIDDLAAIVDPEAEVDERLEKLDEKVGDTCFVVQLRDGKTLAQNVEKALRARGLHAGRKTEDYADTKIHRLVLLGSLPIEYAFAGDVFVLGIGAGEGTMRNVRSVIDAVAARAKGEAAAELGAPVLARLQGWPGDWATIDVSSLTEALDGMIGSFDAIGSVLATEGLALQDLGIWQVVREFGVQLRPQLLRHGADVSVTVGYHEKGRLIARSRW